MREGMCVCAPVRVCVRERERVTYPPGDREDMHRTVVVSAVTSSHKQQVLLVIVDIATTPYLMYWEPMQHILLEKNKKLYQ